MSLKHIWNLVKKKKDNRNNHTFSDEDRKTASMTKIYNQKIKDMENKMKFMDMREKYEELQDLYGYNEDDNNEDSGSMNMEKMLMDLLMNKLAPAGNNASSQPQPPENAIIPAGFSVTPEKIKILKKEIPSKYLKKAISIMEDQ